MAMRDPIGVELNINGAPNGVRSGQSSLPDSLKNDATVHGDGTGRAMAALQEISVIDLLEQEERPTFIIDLTDATMVIEKRLRLSYANPAMKAFPEFAKFLTNPESLSAAYISFVNWVVAPARHEGYFDPGHTSHVYLGMTWTASSLKKRWRVISGSWIGDAERSSDGEDDHEKVKTSLAPRQADGSDQRAPPLRPLLVVHGPTHSSRTPPRSITPSLDWTRTPPPRDMSDHVKLIRSVDWAATTLGPVESWSDHLRHACLLLTAHPDPCVMFWGLKFSDLTIMYNEAFAPLAACKHPSLMGKWAEDAFPKAYNGIKPLIAEVYQTAKASTFEDMVMFLDRGWGPEEEAYFSFTLLPIIGLDDTVVGLFQTVVETTKQKITQRRLSTLLSVGENVATSQNMKAFWSGIVEALDANGHDVPFALLYSAVEELDSGSDSASTGSSLYSGYKRLGLEGTVGIPENHPAAPTYSELTPGREGFVAFLQQSAKMKEPMLLRTEDGTLPESLVRGLEPRGFGDQCKAAVICPIRPTTGLASANESPLAFLIMGLNPRRPYDDDCKNFVRLLARHITTSMASVLLREEEIRRGRTLAEQAAMDQAKLEQQLSVQAKELEHSELKLKRFADCVPAGIFVVDFSTSSLGTYAYRNDKWFELTNDSREDIPAWESPIWKAMVKADVPIVHEAWGRVMQGSSASFEFRMPSLTPPTSENAGEHTWILVTADPLKDAGKVKTVIGSATDITLQKRRMEEVLESKQQQERFIDMTSHEMRNPLSAIMQCADDTLTSIKALSSEATSSCSQLRDFIADVRENAQTISHCAQHQKRIIDDILTMSKLDAGLFTITPIQVQPAQLLRHALKMFEGEFHAADIDSHLEITDGYRDLKVDWVLLDSSRLLQILINLITNAIKFTRLETRRKVVKVSLDASVEKPPETYHGVGYLPTRRQKEDLTLRPDFGNGEVVYLHFAVRDTGRGLSPDDKAILFNRYGQAPRTHVKYGGSGLGLYISRELTEMQGGEIGVASEAGVGSTFAFYLKSRRCTPPAAAFERRASDHVQQSALSLAKQSIGPTIPSTPPGGGQDQQKVPLAADANVQLRKENPQRHVLIVEDNLVNQRVLSKQLTKIGCKVTVANHGGEALDQLQKTKFWRGREDDGQDLSVVLMDLEMPVMDGLTCVRKIREKENEGEIRQHVPVIAVTANARVEQINSALGAGMDDVVSKPFHVPDLMDQIERLENRFSSRPASSPSWSP